MALSKLQTEQVLRLGHTGDPGTGNLSMGEALDFDVAERLIEDLMAEIKTARPEDREKITINWCVTWLQLITGWKNQH